MQTTQFVENLRTLPKWVPHRFVYGTASSGHNVDFLSLRSIFLTTW